MKPQFTILVAEDEESDFLLLQRAFRKNQITDPIHWVRDGTEVLEYLQGSGKYVDRTAHPYPELVILDLKMPRMTGLEVLEWVKKNPDFRVIPTIVMSSSKLDSDVKQAYELGVNTYFVKPSEFDTLVRLVKDLHDYWASGIRPRVAPQVQ